MVSRLFLMAVLTAVLVTSVATIGLDNSSGGQQSANAAKDSKGCGSGSHGDTSSGGKCLKGPKSNNGDNGDGEPEPTPQN